MEFVEREKLLKSFNTFLWSLPKSKLCNLITDLFWKMDIQGTNLYQEFAIYRLENLEENKK